MSVDSSTIVITGAFGQLGRALQARFPNATALSSAELDITDGHAVAGFNWSPFTTIINAAAYTNVDGAETIAGRQIAWRVNATGAQNLVQAAVAHDLILIHISSDYVFDGHQSMHTEDEPFTPLNVYGQSKAAGDLVVGLIKKHYIVRTSWVIGEGNNFVRTMSNLAARDVAPNVVDDQIGRLTFTETLVDATHHLLRTGSTYGTYNVTNSGEPASWADIARSVFAATGKDAGLVHPVSTREYGLNKPKVALRPLMSTLSLDKITTSGFNAEDWKQNLERYVGRIIS